MHLSLTNTLFSSIASLTFVRIGCWMGRHFYILFKGERAQSIEEVALPNIKVNAEIKINNKNNSKHFDLKEQLFTIVKQYRFDQKQINLRFENKLHALELRVSENDIKLRELQRELMEARRGRKKIRKGDKES
jgi:hypothetical protein